MMERFLEYTVGQYMTRQVKTVTRKTTLRELEVWFEKHDCNAFPVVEGKELVGLVTKFDFLKAFAFPTREMLPQYDELMNRTVGEVMTTTVVHREPAAPLTNALQLMIHHRARSLPVVAPPPRPHLSHHVAIPGKSLGVRPGENLRSREDWQPSKRE